MSLKENWKATGDEFIKAFTVLGKTLVKTAKEGAKILDEWANTEDETVEETEEENTSDVE